MARPNLLVVHPRVNFLNPTTNLWPKLFEAVGNVRYFGPGRVSDSTLALGLRRFVESSKEPFDFLVISELVTNPDGEGGSTSRARQLTRIYGYEEGHAEQFLVRKAAWLREAQELAIPTVLTFFEFDPYRVSSEWVDRVGLWPQSIIMGWGAEFVRPIDQLPRLASESFADRASDAWHTLLSTAKAKTLSQPAFVDDSEFYLSALGGRPKDWSILGTNYSERRHARLIAKQYHLSQSGRYLHPAVAAYDRLTRGSIGSKNFTKLSQIAFRRALRRSRASFTCGSALEYPVRKMFEIPAAGSLLVMRPTTTSRALGFEPNWNFVAGAPLELPEISALLRGPDLEALELVAVRGQELVRGAHSLTARIPMLREALQRASAGSFRGSYWVDGHHVFR